MDQVLLRCSADVREEEKHGLGHANCSVSLINLLNHHLRYHFLHTTVCLTENNLFRAILHHPVEFCIRYLQT